MTELEGRSRIDPQALDCRAYLMSLLAEGQRCGLVSDRDMARLLAESLTLLSRQGDTWSRGQSSSLPAEKAQLLLGSVFYTAGLALKAAATPETAAHMSGDEIAVREIKELAGAIKELSALNASLKSAAPPRDSAVQVMFDQSSDTWRE